MIEEETAGRLDFEARRCRGSPPPSLLICRTRQRRHHARRRGAPGTLLQGSARHSRL